MYRLNKDDLASIKPIYGEVYDRLKTVKGEDILQLTYSINYIFADLKIRGKADFYTMETYPYCGMVIAIIDKKGDITKDCGVVIEN